jgi:DNA-directed RNA polymerase subunit RPC12/RpoP
MKCDRCKKADKHWYMVILWDKLWESIAKKEEYLCPDCIEKALGRKIRTEDLQYCDEAYLLGYHLIPVNVMYSKATNVKYPPISDIMYHQLVKKYEGK